MYLRFFAVVACALAFGSASAQEFTPEQLISNSIEAMGGTGKLTELRTLSFTVVTPGRKPLDWEIKRPNLVRKERADDLILVFDGSRAGFIKSPPDKDGNPRAPHVVSEEDWHHFEMDIALYIPAFLDYPAEYEGTKEIGGTAVHLLSVKLPMGAVAVYGIDAETFLPMMVRLPGWDYDRCLGGLTEVNGITYPLEFWDCSDPDKVGTIKDLRINVVLEDDRFGLPAKLE